MGMKRKELKCTRVVYQLLTSKKLSRSVGSLLTMNSCTCKKVPILELGILYMTKGAACWYKCNLAILFLHVMLHTVES